jgi:KDO2-lipid IV(A) lauroyltransferase
MRFVLGFLARLPLPLLYGLGAFGYFVTYHVMRWQRDRAARNLARAFPEKSDAERTAILKQNYWNFGQVLAEALWGFAASREEIARRVVIENLELVEKFERRGHTVLLLTAHVCNWEWLLPAGGAHFKFPIDTVYKPVRLEAADRFLREARSRFGGTPIPMQSFLYELMRRSVKPRVYALVADQTPQQHMEDKYWTRFLNQDTAFYTGADKIAQFMDAPVIYVAMRRTSRGHYAVTPSVLAEPPYEPGADLPVMERFVRKLEEEIHANPADWTWMYNKWKYPKPADADDVARARKARRRKRVPAA